MAGLAGVMTVVPKTIKAVGMVVAAVHYVMAGTVPVDSTEELT